MKLGLPTDYQEFIAKSRYAKWRDEDNRRETWEETVNRYYAWLKEHLQERCNYTIPDNLLYELQHATMNLEVMPSMRALMTAGIAAQRDEIATYNCSYTVVDDIRTFDEVAYILLCGTGVGFSVEARYVNKLPVVAETMTKSDKVIVVEDSKIGWCEALRELISDLYEGNIPSWDTSLVRPAGAKLKTFGGRASGPGPLVQLFEFVTQTITHAKGRQLTTLECHDILCKIGEAVVVGGVDANI